MSTFEPAIMLDEKRYNFMASMEDVTQTRVDELAQLKFQLDVLKNGVSLISSCCVW